ncbi:uncharacterized protein Dwil_GK14293 [Drosophila willistoni]|uniref:Uncharacterized protein n=1 Tax=Drosophila willistoni TaxID=7260 RepID=B4NI80_DROWI|nr:uncharacterized protein Dwil_GK14293 [Drosophila willistoni]
MADENQDDLEDKLDNFIICKPTSPKSENATKVLQSAGPTIHKGIPLTLSDISRSKQDPDRQHVFITGNWHFETCIVHAFVADRGSHNSRYYKYILDDGTASLEVSIPANIEKHKQIASLSEETSTLGDRITSGSLKRLLTKSNEFIDASIITPGMSILLDGRPNTFGDHPITKAVDDIVIVFPRSFDI